MDLGECRLRSRFIVRSASPWSFLGASIASPFYGSRKADSQGRVSFEADPWRTPLQGRKRRLMRRREASQVSQSRFFCWSTEAQQRWDAQEIAEPTGNATACSFFYPRNLSKIRLFPLLVYWDRSSSQRRNPFSNQVYFNIGNWSRILHFDIDGS